VFSDDLPEMVKQARFLASLGDNVYVKIPVTNTLAASTAEVVRQLSSEGVKVNVTALTTVQQVREVAAAIAADVPACISVFAGRIADTGIDPLPTMVESVALLADRPSIELIWASPRELLNVVQASEIGCHIITVTTDLLKKLPLLGTDLLAYSLDTVKMFASDAQAAGYVLDV
jgi:transaldolase